MRLIGACLSSFWSTFASARTLRDVVMGGTDLSGRTLGDWTAVAEQIPGVTA